jgi:hypothetical protein
MANLALHLLTAVSGEVNIKTYTSLLSLLSAEFEIEIAHYALKTEVHDGVQRRSHLGENRSR